MTLTLSIQNKQTVNISLSSHRHSYISLCNPLFETERCQLIPGQRERSDRVSKRIYRLDSLLFLRMSSRLHTPSCSVQVRWRNTTSQKSHRDFFLLRKETPLPSLPLSLSSTFCRTGTRRVIIVALYPGGCDTVFGVTRWMCHRFGGDRVGGSLSWV